MADAQVPDPSKKYWWLTLAVPILAAFIGVMGQWLSKPGSGGASNSGTSTLLWLLPIAGFVVGAAAVSVLVFFLSDDLPLPVLFLFATFGVGFAIWAAVTTTDDPHGSPLSAMIFLAISGISMLAFAIACAARELHFGAYVGGCAAAVAAIFLIIWETGSGGGWVTEGSSISDAPGPFHTGFAVLLTLGVALSVRHVLVWASLTIAVLSIVATIVMDFNGTDGAEASPLGLGALLLSIVLANVALRGQNFNYLPDWVQGCTRVVAVFGGLALAALGILSLATSPSDSPKPFDGTALAVGLLAIFIAAKTQPSTYRRRRL